MRIFYSPQYCLAEFGFETTRKSSWIYDSLLKNPIPNVEIVAPVALSAQEIEGVHYAGYVEAVKTGSPRVMAQGQGFLWDARLWEMVVNSNAGICDAVEVALKEGVSGSLSSGCHHAGWNYGKGFCTFNGLVLAAKRAQKHGAQNICILDFDAHWGGGTHHLLEKETGISQVDVTVAAYDAYSCRQCKILYVEDTSQYLSICQTALDSIKDADLCIYNAGMDPYEECPIGGRRGIDKNCLARRESMVFEWAAAKQIPIVFALAGGYLDSDSETSRTKLVDLHRLTITRASLI